MNRSRYSTSTAKKGRNPVGSRGDFNNLKTGSVRLVWMLVGQVIDLELKDGCQMPWSSTSVVTKAHYQFSSRTPEVTAWQSVMWDFIQVGDFDMRNQSAAENPRSVPVVQEDELFS